MNKIAYLEGYLMKQGSSLHQPTKSSWFAEIDKNKQEKIRQHSSKLEKEQQERANEFQEDKETDAEARRIANQFVLV